MKLLNRKKRKNIQEIEDDINILQLLESEEEPIAELSSKIKKKTKLRLPRIKFPIRKSQTKKIDTNFKKNQKIKDFHKKRDYILSHLDLLSTDSKTMLISRHSGALVALIYRLIPMKFVRDLKVYKIIKTYQFNFHFKMVNILYEDIKKTEGIIIIDPTS